MADSGKRETDDVAFRAGLPDSMPDDLRDFVRGRRESVVLPAGPVTWIPRPRLGPIPLPNVSAHVRFAPRGPQAVDIEAKWGMIGVTIPCELRNGELRADTKRVKGIGSQVANWVDAVNADFRAQGRHVAEVRLVTPDAPAPDHPGIEGLYLRTAPGTPAAASRTRKRVAAGLAGGAIVAGGAAAAAARSRRSSS